MKIAILTQPLGKNYGGIMQAWALQKVLRDLGHDVTTIDRQFDERPFIKKLLLPFKPLIFKVLGRRLYPELSHEQSQYVYSGMTGFIKNNMQMSQPINSTASLKEHYKSQGYDLVVVGSDQVWRPQYSPNIYNFFVDFLEEGDKSISYAASFGVDNWEFDSNQTQVCKELAQKFNAISVREKSAIDLCKDKLDIEAQFVLDPTLLVSAAQYEELLADHISKNKGKVLTYVLDRNASKEKIINQVAQHLGKEIFTAQPIKDVRDAADSTDFKDIDKYKYPAVEEWISSFRDADFVITDSFHGCVFSIIFNKPFIAIGNKERGLSRFHSLLSTFQLTDRLVLSDEKAILELVDQKIDWESANTLLTEYQVSSKEFLSASV